MMKIQVILTHFQIQQIVIVKNTNNTSTSSINSGSSTTNNSEDSDSDFGSVNQKNTSIIGKLDSE